MKKIIYIFSLFIVAQSTFADSSTTTLTIKNIETGWSSEGVYIRTNEEIMLEGCTSSTLRVNSDHLMLDKILSIALSAFHTKSKVTFRVSGCTGTTLNAVAISVLD